MKKSEVVQVAETINAQIRTGRWITVGSWGFNSPGAFRSPEGLPGLVFKVRGRLHSGMVFVALDPSDTYTIFTARPDFKGGWTEVADGVYCDTLTDTLDSIIERKVA